MIFRLTESDISAGEDCYPLGTLNSWKLWHGDDGRHYLKIVPMQGKHEIYEVEPGLTFKDVDGEAVSPDYFIITWRRGMAKPECVIRIGEMTGKGTFEQKAPEPERKRRGRSYNFEAEEREEDDGA